MPASIRLGDTSVRPDFIIGDRFGAAASPALSEHTIATLGGMGYAVAHNKPYAGGFITSITDDRHAATTRCRSK